MHCGHQWSRLLGLLVWQLIQSRKRAARSNGAREGPNQGAEEPHRGLRDGTQQCAAARVSLHGDHARVRKPSLRHPSPMEENKGRRVSVQGAACACSLSTIFIDILSLLARCRLNPAATLLGHRCISMAFRWRRVSAVFVRPGCVEGGQRAQSRDMLREVRFVRGCHGAEWIGHPCRER